MYKTTAVLVTLLLMTACLPTRVATTRTLYVVAVSPCANGLSTYYIKSRGMRGHLKLVDSSLKWKAEDKFILKEVTTLY